MSDNKQYICEQLSHNPSLVSKWIDKFLALRHPGIENDPKKTYGEESGRSIQEWITLLSKPAYHVVVCAARDGMDSADILDREWVGIMLVYGPRYRNRSPGSATQHQRPKAFHDTVWFVGGVFVKPSHRQRNITALLLEHSAKVKFRESLQPRPLETSPSGVIIQGVVTPERKGLQEYHKTMGMMPVRRMTRREHCDLWGIPFDASIGDKEVIIIERQEKENTSRL